MTGDTSFVENPPTSVKPQSKYGPTTSTAKRATATRGTVSSRGNAATRGRTPVAGTDENGRRINRMPSGVGRGRATAATRGRGSYNR